MKYPLLFLLILSFCPISIIIAQQNDQDLSQLSYEEIDSIESILSENTEALGNVIPYLIAARKKAEKEFGKTDTIVALYSGKLASYYIVLGELEKARTFYKEANTIQSKLLAETHPHFIFSLKGLAEANSVLASYEKAEKGYLRVLALEEQTIGIESVDYAKTLNELAEIARFLSEYEKGEALFLQAKDIFEKVTGSESSDYALVIGNLSILYMETQQYEKAELLLLQTLSLEEKISGKEHTNYAASLNNLAMFYLKMGRYKKAEVTAIKAKNIQEKVLGKNHPNFATSLNNLALMYYNMGNIDKALLYLKEALKVVENNFGLNHPSVAVSLDGLAILSQVKGDFKSAKQHLMRSNNINTQNYGPKHPAVANTLNNLSALFQALGEPDSTFHYCKLALVANSFDIEPNGIIWSKFDEYGFLSIEIAHISITGALGALYDKNRNKSKEEIDTAVSELSYRLVQAGAQFINKIRADFSDKSDKLRVLQMSNDWMIRGISTGISTQKPVDDAFWFSESNKAILLLEAAKTAKDYKLGNLPDSLVKQEKKLQNEHALLEAQLMGKHSKTQKDSIRAALNSSNEKIGRFNKLLKQNYPKYVALKYEQHISSAKDIQAALAPNTSLIEYALNDSIIYIFYIDKQEIKLETVHLQRKELSNKTKAFHAILSDYNLALKNSATSYQKYTVNAHWFYQKLIKPVLEDVSGIKNLIIVTDGELGHLPFETFLVEQAPQSETDYHELHYLRNDYNISYNYSATLWSDNLNTASNSNNGQLLAMASNYDIRLDATKNSWRQDDRTKLREGLNPLPAARKEVEALEKSFSGFFGFDKMASERVFKEKASDYAIIHLAMHGLLDSEHQILSNLAFTEDSDSLNDNFLHAYEISKMELNADLVVLSACETGYGKFDKGNGIASLAQAFTLAGTPSLIVSLWQVNDFATSNIMKSLYANLAKGLPKDQALNLAKMEYMKSVKGVLAHPAFWSPFIQIGNTKPIKFGQSDFSSWLWILAAGLVLVGGFAVYRKTRSA